MFRSFAVANYRLWFAGALVSNIGTWMQRIAQDWIVLTQLTNGDATAVGITTALQFGPQLLLLPLTGLVADRFDRRHVLMITQATMGLLGLGLGLITVFQVVELWMVFAFALALGVAAAFDAPARQAFVGELVPPRLLGNAVALNSASFNGARLIGPAVAGLLTAAVGAGWVFLINAATFAAVLVALALLRPSEFQATAQTAPRARADPCGVPLRAQATRHPAGLRHDLPHRHVRVQLPDLHLDDVARVRARRERVRRALVGARDRLALWRPLRRSPRSASTAHGDSRERRLRRHPRSRLARTRTSGSSVCTLVLVGLSGLTMMTSANGYVQTTTTPSMRGRVMALYLAIFLGGTPDRRTPDRLGRRCRGPALGARARSDLRDHRGRRRRRLLPAHASRAFALGPRGPVADRRRDGRGIPTDVEAATQRNRDRGGRIAALTCSM